MDIENVTGQSYKRVLQYYVFPQLWNYPEDMAIWRDSSSSYYTAAIRQYL